jgi:4-aminobutyrate--pyruvate transaminase
LADHPLVGEARGLGMIGGLELVADKRLKTPFDPKLTVGAKTAALIQEEGLIIRPIGDTLGLCPPLIISEAEIDELFDMLGRGLDKADEMVRKQGYRVA